MKDRLRVPPLLVALAVLSLACAGVVSPTAAPMQAEPSPGAPTVAPSMSPTGPTPRPSATPLRSSSPTRVPSSLAPPISASPSAGQAGTFLEVIRDDMSSPRSGFQTGDFEHHRVAYEESRLIVEVKGPGRSTWTMRGFGDWPLVDVEARVDRPDPAVDGFYGLTCGRSNDDFYAGLLDDAGGTVLLRVVAGQATVLLRDDTPVTEASDTGPVDMSLSCAGSDAGGSPGLSLSVGHRVVASAADPSGFVSFLRGGFYIESGSDVEGSLMTADDFRVMAGLVGHPLPGPSLPSSGDPAVDALMLHIPEDLRDLCQPANRTDLAADVAVDCGTAEVPVATYLQYSDTATMNADYDTLVKARPSATGSSCQVEPSEGPYTVGDVEVGRLLCVLDDGAATIYWTDERLSIMGHTEAADDSFAGLYAWWLEAGPLP